MPSIVIQEKDETLAGNAASSVDVAFVPGFADTNSNYIILTESGLEPQEIGLMGCVPDAVLDGIYATAKNIHNKRFTKPCYACNTVDKRTWVCVAETEDAAGSESNHWNEQTEVAGYVAPCPENYPVLCSSLAEFEAYFGTTPYKFIENQDISSFFETGVVAKGNKYMYRAGDYEKSYIYAKELIKLGIPVIYENICNRGVETFNYASQYGLGRADSKVPTGYTVVADKYAQTMGELAARNLTFVLSDVANGVWKCAEYADKHISEGNEVNRTPATSTLCLGDTLVISPSGENYTATFTKVSKAVVFVNSEILKSYMKSKGKLSLTVKFKYNGTAWALDGAPVDISEYGVSVNGISNMNDTIDLASTYNIDYSKSEPTVKFFYENVKDCFTNSEKLLDKGELTVKYITCGAYPVYELKEAYEVVPAMITCAHDRGDAVAIIDHANNPERSLKTVEGSGSVYAHIVKTEGNGLMGSDEYNAFATMFTPWATYSCVTAPKGATTQLMPASFAYLTSVGVSIVTNANFLAVAGVNRGLPSTIKELNTIERMSNTIADAYQPRDKRALNAITNIKPYGLTIWGNRTLVSNAAGNLTATSFLNVRNMVSDIKKVAYSAAKSLIYEQDSEILWGKFKNKITPTLDRMVNGYGLSSYKIIRATTKYNGEGLAKGEIAAVIKIYPVYAVEDFEITVVMADNDISVS